MIISVYDGCGMSNYARSTWDGIEISALPYRYIMPERSDEMDPGEIIEDPEVTEYPLDPKWPYNYISAIDMAYHRYACVVIPMIREVLEELKKLRLPYVLCYPASALSEKEWMWIREDAYARHIVLEEGQTPEDHRDAIRLYTKEQEVLLPLLIDRKISAFIQEDFENIGLPIEEKIRQELIDIAENLAKMKEGHDHYGKT